MIRALGNICDKLALDRMPVLHCYRRPRQLNSSHLMHIVAPPGDSRRTKQIASAGNRRQAMFYIRILRGTVLRTI